MAVLGNIIKTAIELKDRLSADDPAVLCQERVLLDLLQKAKDTQFGRKYNFTTILQAPDVAKAFSKAIPVHDHNKIYREWWHKTVAGEADVTWPGKPTYMAYSSGTTNLARKKIPVTEDMLQATRKTSLQQVTCLANFDLPPEFFEKDILMLCSSTNLIENGIFKEGDISGINASNIPFWFKTYCKPGDEILRIDNWEERIQRIALEAPNWDVGSLSGIPSWIELMLKKIIEYNGIRNIHEIWPNLEVYATGGVAFGPYQKGLEKLLARPLIYIDTYFASEGFLAFQSRPETHAMALATDNGIYFEFVPFNAANVDENGAIKPGAEVLPLAEIRQDEEYVVLISTVSGAWRYLIGDTVKFVNRKKSEIIITGRTKHFLNVVGSKLSVDNMNWAIQKLEDELGMTINEFTVSAILTENNYAHKWYIGSEDTVDENKIVRLLDESLKKINHSYENARSRALKHVIVKIIPPGLFYDWNAIKNKKGGQVKTPRVMKEDQFIEWENFVARELSWQ
ncbi:putative auxin-regulated protein [Fulvivirga imtechensis AK7]|uniref:Putative auxin-regulated protein n=1 Tax=Fulvivirga imtechensis AK7 TaxID=1237149 RepID=L8K022_9BACT|nr:GH3 auxin-responsive promoter family protein [Fulvivirga imtechensis]ELR73274.1 putative auxin-regulated protein [Fulvivirga imtechensis AK7]